MKRCVFGRVIYTGREVRNDAYLVFDDRMLTGIASAEQGTLAGRYDAITPAFIDSHAHIGMVRAGEPRYEAEVTEKMDPIVPCVDALDSIQMDDPAFVDSIESGVLYSCIVPGSGDIMAGRTAVVRNYGRTTTDALVGRAGIKAALGYNPINVTDWKGARPCTRMGVLALVRQKLHDVRQKLARKETLPEDKAAETCFSLEETVLADLLQGRDKLRVHAHKADDIASLLRLVDEFDLSVIVEHAGGVFDPGVFRELADRGIPVNYGPIDSFAYKVELRHKSWRNLRWLLESGVRFGLMSDHPVSLQRMLLHQLRWLLRLGLNRSEALAVITRRNAEILGLEEILGTLEQGKWASFVGWNGDPFDLTRYPVAVYGEGKKLYAE